MKFLENLSLSDLITVFLRKGGRINKYYLRDLNRGKPAILYLNGWFGGQNVRAAILKAFAKIQKPTKILH